MQSGGASCSFSLLALIAGGGNDRLGLRKKPWGGGGICLFWFEWLHDYSWRSMPLHLRRRASCCLPTSSLFFGRFYQDAPPGHPLVGGESCSLPSALKPFSVAVRGTRRYLFIKTSFHANLKPLSSHTLTHPSIIVEVY